MESKTELRKRMRKVRDAISEALRMEKSRAIARQICAAPWYGSTACIFVYAAIRSEVDLTFFCERAWADGKRLFFPKVDGEQMEFYHVTGEKQLKKGAFSVPEPDPTECPPAASQDIAGAVLLVPGVAFSKEGYRIGYGGGFYDRYLERKTGIYPAGICFTEQLTQAFVPEAHDRRMREIITEQTRLTM
jgi:5-formyltetrahydrofolate cyclo-ligase